MWLIETRSLKLGYFLGKPFPHYSILSHTWGDGEVTFQDWQDLRKASKKTGFAKIKSAYAQAQADGLKYIWIDTNCIDKSSSADLSEAINSMFAWYKNSRICYVYLADVKDPDNVAGNLGNESEELDCDDGPERQNAIEDRKKARFKDSLRKSRWFTRGWTLQELLAPRSIRFFTQDWKPISMGSRYHSQLGQLDANHERFKELGVQEPLLRLISGITGIRLDVLTLSKSVVSCSNGEKMSWIAGRKTTREEDIAYCLLGIFDINMPLLYGEGRKAFARLQEEIIKQSTDYSLFAWQWPHRCGSLEGNYPNLFTDSPRLFFNWNELLIYDRQSESELYKYNNPLSTVISLTNFGMSINLELIPTAHPNYIFGVLYGVNYEFRSHESLLGRELWCIPLQKMGQIYHRAPFPPSPIPVRTRRKRSVYPVHIPRRFYLPGLPEYRYQHAFVLFFPDFEIGAGFRIGSLKQKDDTIWSPEKSTVFIPRGILQDGRIVASILSLEGNEACSLLLYVGAREVNNVVETAVKLFPAGTSLGTVENTQMTFRPPRSYRDECRPFSLVVSKGYCFNLLPPQSAYSTLATLDYGPNTIFSVSIYIDQKAAEPEIEEIRDKSKSEEASDSKARTPPPRKVI